MGPLQQDAPTENIGLVLLLNSVSKAIRAINGLRLGESGFHNGQDELLSVVAEGPAAVGLIAERLRVRPSTVSKMADRLIEKGLLERVTDDKDCRRTLLSITDAGVSIQASLSEAQTRFEKELTRSVEPSTLSDIAGALEELNLVLDARLRRLR